MINEEIFARQQADAHEAHLLALERFTSADQALRAKVSNLELDAMLSLFTTEVAFPMGLSHPWSVIAQMLIAQRDSHATWCALYERLSRTPEFAAYRIACDLLHAAGSYEQALDRTMKWQSDRSGTQCS